MEPTELTRLIDLFAPATDTGNESGALYKNIWKLIWSLAYSPSVREKDEYIAMV